MSKKTETPAYDADAHSAFAEKLFEEIEADLPLEYGLTISLYHIPTGHSRTLSGITTPEQLAAFLFREAAAVAAIAAGIEGPQDAAGGRRPPWALPRGVH